MIGDIHHMYQDLRDRLKRGESGLLPPLMTQVAATVTTHAIDRTEVQTHVLDLSQHSGWVRLQSAVFRTGPGEHKGLTEEEGLPLMGEWLLSETASAHLRQNGKGGWSLFRYQEHPSLQEAQRAASSEGQARDCLRQRVSVIAADGPADAADPDRLAYDVYWDLEHGAMRRLFARFAGFVPSNGG